ncbi:MAG TPA: acyl-CoA desaturase [Nevskiaceae bacterium]|nr:acyl-CoA desaturase [Nevskiaceae bacterium]
MRPTLSLSRAQIDEIEREFDALRNQVLADLGERDAQHIRRTLKLAQSCAIAGRGLLMFGFTPVSWALGVAALSTAKILENMEIGHNVMHGQYDWMDDPRLQSQTYDWDNVCDGEDWRQSHNVTHHTWTNVLGKDPDVGYGVLRVSESQGWRPRYFFQPVWNGLLSLWFQWGVGVHQMDLANRLYTAEGRAELKKTSAPFLRKARKQLVKDYVLFPALALWNAPRVLLGNLAANGIRNVWSNVIIFCGHFPEGTRVYTEAEIANETRGDWYVRQMQGSANIEGGRWFHLLSGHLSHQIEHHLFPDLPAHRYPEIAAKVREVCERHGIPYNTGSFGRQYGSVVKRLFKLALPRSRDRDAGPGPARELAAA